MTGEGDASENRSRTPTRKRRNIELTAALTLALAGTLTGWNGYQAARWGGQQSISFGQASALRIESARASGAADALRAIDLAMFTSWVEAYAAGETELDDFYRERFRDEFKPAFEEWVASEPVTSPDAEPSPFSLPAYRLADAVRSQELADSAEATFARGQNANRLSDRYVLNTALLGTVLFLTGIVQQFKVARAQEVILAIASVLLLIGIYNAVVLPKL